MVLWVAIGRMDWQCLPPWGGLSAVVVITTVITTISWDPGHDLSWNFDGDAQVEE